MISRLPDPFKLGMQRDPQNIFLGGGLLGSKSAHNPIQKGTNKHQKVLPRKLAKTAKIHANTPHSYRKCKLVFKLVGYHVYKIATNEQPSAMAPGAQTHEAIYKSQFVFNDVLLFCCI